MNSSELVGKIPKCYTLTKPGCIFGQILFTMSDFHTLTIQNIHRETPSAVTLTFGVPDALKEVYQYKAGQYITLKAEINGEEVRRAYSLCSAPSSGLLQVAVKEVENGTFSVLANNKLTVGQSIDVHTPEGKFIFVPNGERQASYAAFAAGSGITPILSIIKSVLIDEPKSTFVLVYGNRSLEGTMFHKVLLELQLEYPDRFFVEFFYSRTQEPNSNFGRIERSTINYVVRNKFKAHQFSKFFLCGPEPMINLVAEVLEDKGTPKEDILFELFSSSATAEVNAALDGNTALTVICDDEEFNLTMPQNKVILDVVLEAGIDAPHSCQGGICSSCIARITSGTATMRKNLILTDEEVEEGLILTCQAHPTSATITIDYDEV